ncbi:MAG: beta-propeller domain-containing protein [Pseudobdellovibrionaceae bacterium]
MFKQIFFGAFTVLALSGCLDKELQNRFLGGDEGSGDPKPPKVYVKLPQIELKQRSFGSCSEYRDFASTRRAEIKNAWKEYEAYLSELYSQPGMPSMPVDAAPISAVPGSSSGPQTNIQEEGINEADILKGNSRFLFYVGTKAVFVHDKVTKDLVQTIDLESAALSTKLYAKEDYLAILSSRTTGAFESSLRVYKEDSSGVWTQVKEKRIQGSLVSTREVDGKILLFSKNSNSETLTGIESRNCDNIYYATFSDLDESVTVASVVDFSEQTSGDNDTVMLGGFDQFYAGLSGVYLIRTNLNWFHWDNRFNSMVSFFKEKMTAVRMELKNGMMVPTSAGILHGTVRNVWAFKEFPESKSLAVTSTSMTEDLTAPTEPDETTSSASPVSGRTLIGSSPPSPSQQLENRNQLTIYDFSSPIATKRGQTEEFARTEDVRAVRYIGDLAYVVTFKKTDPLYTIDLSDLSHPKIIGELKIPGFSAYLHPIGEKALLGIGYDAQDEGDFAWYQGLQVSLYDLTNPNHVVENEKIKMGGRGSYAPVVDDHHAFYINDNIVGFPFLLREGTDNPWQPGKLIDSGLALLNVSDIPLTLRPIKHLSHKNWISEKCWNWMEYQYTWWTEYRVFTDFSVDINRVYIEGNEVVTFSPLGLKVYSKSDYATELKEVAYESHQPKCEYTPYYVD